MLHRLRSFGFVPNDITHRGQAAGNAMNAGGDALAEWDVSKGGHGRQKVEGLEEQSQATPGAHANKKTATEICFWLFAAFRGEFPA
jgi:hypothetical protein